MDILKIYSTEKACLIVLNFFIILMVFFWFKMYWLKGFTLVFGDKTLKPTLLNYLSLKRALCGMSKWKVFLDLSDLCYWESSWDL